MLARVGPRLAVLLAATYLGFGIVEITAHRSEPASTLLYWGLTLLGGSLLVLAGVVALSRSVDLGRALVTGGAVLGIVATLWTIVVPLLAGLVIVFALREPSRGPNRAAGAGAP